MAQEPSRLAILYLGNLEEATRLLVKLGDSVVTTDLSFSYESVVGE